MRLNENGPNLPDDVLAAVFSLCSNGVDLPPKFEEAPWTLTRVCSRWRKVGMRASELWSDLKFQSIPTGSEGECLAELEACVVERCNGRPISISCPIPITPSSKSKKITTTYFVNHFVNPFAGQLKRLDYHGGSGGIRALFKLPFGYLPLLEELNLHVRIKNEGHHDTWKTPSVVFQSSSRLRRVTFQGPEFTFSPAVLALPWEQLESLAILDINISPKSLFDFLPSCKSLTNLRINSDSLLSSFSSPIILPSLVTLDTDGMTLDMGILSGLRSPNLRFLTLRFNSKDWGFNRLFRMLARESCQHLEGLNLVHKFGYEPRITTNINCILDVLSSFKSPISDCRFIMAAISKSALARIGSGVFPKLRHFTSLAWSPDDVSCVLAAMESYHRDFGNLETATVIIQKDLVAEKVWEKVTELRLKGLDLRLPKWVRVAGWDEPVQWIE